MSISSGERLFTLTEAAKLIPRRRAGRPTAISSVFRWCQIGIRGIKLEYIQVGGCKMTSTEAIRRFYDALTKQSQAGQAPVKKPAPHISATAAGKSTAQKKTAKSRGLK